MIVIELSNRYRESMNKTHDVEMDEGLIYDVGMHLGLDNS